MLENMRICREKRNLEISKEIVELPKDTAKAIAATPKDISTKPTKIVVRLQEKTQMTTERANLPKEPQQFVCQDCHSKLPKKATRCLECYLKHKVTTRKVERPTLEQLQQDLAEMSMVKVGQKYGVSDNCIRKWMKHYGKAQTSI